MVYIQNSNITDISLSCNLLPITAFKQYALQNPTTLAAGTINPIVTWVFNQTWGYSAMTGLSTLNADNLPTPYPILICPSSNVLTTLLNNSQQHSLLTTTFSSGYSNKVSSPNIVPDQSLQPLPTGARSFVGDTIFFNGFYSSAGVGTSNGGILFTGTNETNSPIWVNLANVVLTFSSNIC
jgi:hypothetical protein